MAEAKDKTPLIEMRGIHKKYGSKIVHRGIDLNVYPGEVLALMGGSGCGKSVLLRMIVGLEKPDSGTIQFRHEFIENLSEQNLVPVRKKIAYVFQYGALFDSFSIKENLAYPLREHTKLTEIEIHEKVLSTLDQVGLKGTENLYPSDLSGGMQRRVGVARSIIMNPEVILYDEPTTGLDPFNTQQILKIILKLKSTGATSILVTHDMTAIFSVTDRVAFMKEGEIVALGTRDEIKNSKLKEVSNFIHGETY
ncbi:MAG: ATP-binding cassette domain-containing protein [Bdellovibrionales bacterium]|nr:ATP-binding cassette domain-containing protein [Bdellovibrionales bacterium]